MLRDRAPPTCCQLQQLVLDALEREGVGSVSCDKADLLQCGAQLLHGNVLGVQQPRVRPQPLLHRQPVLARHPVRWSQINF